MVHRGAALCITAVVACNLASANGEGLPHDVELVLKGHDLSMIQGHLETTATSRDLERLLNDDGEDLPDATCEDYICVGGNLDVFFVANRIDGSFPFPQIPVFSDTILGGPACVQWCRGVATSKGLDFDDLFVQYMEASANLNDPLAGPPDYSLCLCTKGCVELEPPTDTVNTFVTLPKNTYTADDECADVTTPFPETSMNGDPHVKTWTGDYFDYMGECDLVLLHAADFDGQGNDLDIHVRTTIRYDYSYIENAALRIGSDVLEVSSFGDYSINGVDNANANSVGGYQLHCTQVDKKKHTFDVVLSPHQNITLSTYKDLVAVKVSGAESHKYFSKSVGMVGSYFGGVLLGRDGVTDMSSDINAFGQEWQVQGEEGPLFRTARAPQYPQQCNMPSAEQKQARRLGETKVNRNAAEQACSHLAGSSKFTNCVFDVMAVGDLDLAKEGDY